VYANVDGKEHFSFIYEKCTPGLKDFADTRVNDPRTREVYTTEELTRGDLFYITCIGDPQKLAPFYEKYRERYHVVYSKDIYSGEQWLRTASKNSPHATPAPPGAAPAAAGRKARCPGRAEGLCPRRAGLQGGAH